MAAHINGRLTVLALGAAMTAFVGSAWAADPAGLTPHAYSLGETTLVPVVITNRVDESNSGDDVVVTAQRRAQRPTVFSSDTAMPQAVFNVGGAMMTRPADCTTTYTTAGGQPTRETDFTGHVADRACFF